MMSIRQIARILGGDVSGRNRVICPGPGHSRSDRSLCVTISSTAPDGFTVHSFAGDDWQHCKDYVREVLGLGERQAVWSPQPEPQRPDEKTVMRREYAYSLWREAKPIVGTLAMVYLKSRGLAPGDEGYDGYALRFHARCPFRLDSGITERLPAMVAMMRDPLTDVFTGIHRTALAADGAGKANIRGLGSPKRMLGNAGVVKLTPDEEVTYGIHIAEGIETALAAMTVGFKPMWACLSAGGVERFPVIPALDGITIFADADETGRKAGLGCAKQWLGAGKEARLLTPPSGDFNDYWRAAS